MTIYDFFSKWNGKYLDYDHAYGYQCKDVFSQYNNDIVKAPYIVGNPIVLWNNYNNLANLKKFYTKVPNSLTAIPQLGDVIIFNVGMTGHISICTGVAGMFWFTSFEQNYPLGSSCHYVSHNYWKPKVMGWFRPK
jgi:hypothetical protein